MDTNINGRIRNSIFLAFLLISVIALTIALSAISQQNKKLLAEYREYQAARLFILQESYDQAQKILAAFVDIYPQSFSILWDYGYSLANSSNPKKGLEYMERAMELSPVIKTFQKNLTEYGQVLFKSGDYDRSEKYFLESKKYNTNPSLNSIADLYLEKIEAMKKK